MDGSLPAFDSDADGLPDTSLDATGDDLVLRTDLDGDGVADQVVTIGPTAEVTVGAPDVEEPTAAAAAAGRIVAADWEGAWDDGAAAVDPVAVDPDTGRWTSR